MENAERMLVKLSEGEDSKDFPSPPMQLVMDQLAHVKVEQTQFGVVLKQQFPLMSSTRICRQICPPVRSDAFGDDRCMRQFFACGRCGISVHADCCRRGRWISASDDAEHV